jgi:general secretion pathway protein F
MQNFRYRALTQTGEMVAGSISAASLTEVSHRIEYLGLVPIETVSEGDTPASSSWLRSPWSHPRPEDVTTFTRDLALLLKAGARLDECLELLAKDADIGKLRPVVRKIRTAVLAGESFAEVIGRDPSLFPPMYVALVRVGEISGALDQILETLGHERSRAEALRRKVKDALQYPAFVLLAACGVLVFFVAFVLPQFSSVLRDFNAKTDAFIETFLALSDLLRNHAPGFSMLAWSIIAGSLLLWRKPSFRSAALSKLSKLPVVASLFEFHRTALFCRNLGVLLASGVALTATLRILVGIMAATGGASEWTMTADRVRHGGKLSDAIGASAILPAMAVRMLRLGEETGQLPTLAARVAEFYEAKLQRQLDRIVGIVGPVAIIAISVVVGGLIVSVMTALLSVSQAIG